MIGGAGGCLCSGPWRMECLCIAHVPNPMSSPSRGLWPARPILAVHTHADPQEGQELQPVPLGAVRHLLQQLYLPDVTGTAPAIRPHVALLLLLAPVLQLRVGRVPGGLQHRGQARAVGAEVCVCSLCVDVAGWHRVQRGGRAVQGRDRPGALRMLQRLDCGWVPAWSSSTCCVGLMVASRAQPGKEELGGGQKMET